MHKNLLYRMGERRLWMVLLLFGISPFQVLGQEVWTGAKVKWSPWERWGFGVEQELRLDDRYVFYKKFLTETSVSFAIHKAVEIGANYRYTTTPGGDYHRATGDLAFQTDFNDSDFELGYRFRAQREYPERGAEDPMETRIRNKLEVAFTDFGDAHPFFSAELFYQLDDWNKFNQLRLTAGLDFEIGRRWDMKVFYRVEHNYNREFIRNDYIVGARLAFDISAQEVDIQ